LKTTPFFILALIFSLNSLAQFKILDDPGLNKGIYKNFEEFKNNSPSLPLNDTPIQSYSLTASDFGSVPNLIYYNLLVRKKNKKEWGTVFGFCDGYNVYINPSQLPIKKSVPFFRISYFGELCYFETFVRQGINSFVTTFDGNVIDLNTGVSTKLSKESFSELISDDKELLERYKVEPHKYKRMKDYFIEYMGRRGSKK